MSTIITEIEYTFQPGELEWIPGEKIKLFGGWYRHDRVKYNGKLLEGSIQVRRKNKRFDTITCFRDSCVLGSAVHWLIKMNEENGHVGTLPA